MGTRLVGVLETKTNTTMNSMAAQYEESHNAMSTTEQYNEPTPESVQQ